MEADVETVCSLYWGDYNFDDYCIFAVDSDGGVHIIQHSVDDHDNLNDKGNSCPEYFEDIASGRYTKFIEYALDEAPMFFALGKDHKIHLLPDWKENHHENPFMRKFKSDDERIMDKKIL